MKDTNICLKCKKGKLLPIVEPGGSISETNYKCNNCGHWYSDRSNESNDPQLLCPYNGKPCRNNQNCDNCEIQENEGKYEAGRTSEGNNHSIFDRVIELVKNIQSLEEELQESKILIENLKTEMKDLMTEYGGEV